MPFPGKWPTRWRLQFKTNFGATPEWDVIVKPNPTTILKARRFAQRHGYLIYTEFDKGGVIRTGQRLGPRALLDVQGYNPTLLYVYYPWHTTNGEFFGPNRVPLFHRSIKIGDKTVFVYSPFKDMTDAVGIARLREYKLWLHQKLPNKRIDVGKLPPIIVPEMLALVCPECGRKFKKKAEFKNLAVHCPNCAWIFYA